MAKVKLSIYLLLNGVIYLTLLSACGGGNNTQQAQATEINASTQSVKAVNNVNTDSNTSIELAERTYINSASNTLITLNASGSGRIYKNVIATVHSQDSSRYSADYFTWNFDGSNLTIATQAKQQTFAVSADGLNLTDNETKYTAIKPLSLDLLNGKHLQEKLVDNSGCVGRTLSFSGNTLNVREFCGANFNNIMLTVEPISETNNILHAYGLFGAYNLSYYIALQEGDINSSSKFIIRSEKMASNPTISTNVHLAEVFNGNFVAALQASSFTVTNLPLPEMMLSGDSPIESFNYTNRLGCGFFNAHAFDCPADSYLKDIDLDSCLYVSPVWLTSLGMIGCLTDPAKLIANYPADSTLTNRYVKAYGFLHDGSAAAMVGAIE